MGEKTEERRIERDILKEMFPFEASTPTGIRYSDTLKQVLVYSVGAFLFIHLFIPTFFLDIMDT